MLAFRLTISELRIVFLEKSKTSSDKSLRMLSAFSHLLSLSRALLQMSGIKFYHEVVHSNLTMEMRVPLSLVNR